MSDFLSYKNKRVIVSGCYSGMGEATAQWLVELGAEVHGLDFKDSTLKLASFSRMDLRDKASIDAAVAKIGGKVDALFNCAGLPQTAPVMDTMKVNFIGLRHLTERVLPLMSSGSAIANIASTAALGWSRRVPEVMDFIKSEGFEAAIKWCDDHAETVSQAYSFSKEAVVVWTMMTSATLIKRGIRHNCTIPGPTQTPLMSEFEKAGKDVIEAATQPINRRATPKEQAGPLLFLNSNVVASYVNGVVLPVDGGFMGGMATGQVDMSKMMPKAT